jgi:hypothetical protein
MGFLSFGDEKPVGARGQAAGFDVKFWRILILAHEMGVN